MKANDQIKAAEALELTNVARQHARTALDALAACRQALQNADAAAKQLDQDTQVIVRARFDRRAVEAWTRMPELARWAAADVDVADTVERAAKREPPPAPTRKLRRVQREPQHADPQQAILDAFDALDMGRNFVSLADLREQTKLPRATFDAALQALRKSWVLSLDPAEGRHERVPQRVLDAAVREHGELLAYAARR